MTITKRPYSEEAVLYSLAKHGGEAWLSQLEETVAEHFGLHEQATRTAVRSLVYTELVEDSIDSKTTYRLTDEGKRMLRRDAQKRISMVEHLNANIGQEEIEAVIRGESA